METQKRQNEKYLEATSHFKKSLIIDPSYREAMEYLSLCYSILHSQKEGKLRNDSSVIRNSTSETLNTTTTNDVKDLISQNTEFWIEHKMSKTSTYTKCSNNCVRKSSSFAYPKSQEQIEMFLQTTQFVSNCCNNSVNEI